MRADEPDATEGDGPWTSVSSSEAVKKGGKQDHAAMLQAPGAAMGEAMRCTVVPEFDDGEGSPVNRIEMMRLYREAIGRAHV